MKLHYPIKFFVSRNIYSKVVCVHTLGEVDSFNADCWAFVAVAKCQIWLKLVSNCKVIEKKHTAYPFGDTVCISIRRNSVLLSRLPAHLLPHETVSQFGFQNMVSNCHGYYGAFNVIASFSRERFVFWTLNWLLITSLIQVNQTYFVDVCTPVIMKKLGSQSQGFRGACTRNGQQTNEARNAEMCRRKSKP